MRCHSLLRYVVIASVLCVTSTAVFAYTAERLLVATGWNEHGQLGLGDGTNRDHFERVGGVRNVVSMAGGYDFSLAMTNTARIWSTGSNSSGQLGLHSFDAVNVFTATDDLLDATLIAAGDSHSLARSATNGAVWASGAGDHGQLGLGFIASTNAFVDTPRTNITALSGGYGHSLALDTDGNAWATGRNLEGQLGLGDETQRAGFTQIPSPVDVTAIAAGSFHSLLLTSDGHVWVSGFNSFGQLGVPGTDTDAFIQVPDLSNVVAIAAGGYHSLARLSDGTLMVAGYNSQGQLGLGDNAHRSTWTAVPDVSDVIAISAGYTHSLILKSDGTAWTTGANSQGELGLGDALGRNVFTQVPGLAGVVAISAGGYHSLALTAKHITITAPTAPDITVQNGGAYAVTWNSDSLPANAKVIITLRNGAGDGWVLANGVPNKGVWNWRVGTWKSKTQAVYEDGDDYRIEISSTDGLAWDDSDAEFAIGTPDSITIAGPADPEESTTTPYTCTAQYNFGADQDVTSLVKWRALSPNPKDPARYQSCKYAVMQPGGQLLTKAVSADQPIRLTASFGKGKTALADTLDVTIQDVP